MSDKEKIVNDMRKYGLIKFVELFTLGMQSKESIAIDWTLQHENFEGKL